MKLFIDDLRSPLDQTWVVAKSSSTAIDLINQDFPEIISFDHDLGGDDTAMIVVNAIIENVLDGKWEIPDGFQFIVHSANPIGANNIQSKMNNFLISLDIRR